MQQDETTMLATLFQKIYQQLVLLVVVAVVLLAAYVSAGRQFMPVISRYSEFLENQIFINTGIPVAVDALTGSFSGFNPVINVDGMRLAVSDDMHPDEIASNALYFEQATIEVDMRSSVWQRRWVLEQFVIDSLELNLEQNAEGGWQLSGLDVAGDEPVDLNALYQTFLSFSQLDFNNVAINVQTRSGDSLTFTNGLVTIQNQGDTHFVHIDANLERNPEQLSLSMEVQGSELSELEGRLYINIPQADYSALFAEQELGALNIEALHGRGEFWIDLADGNVVSANSSMNIDDLILTIDDSEPLQLTDINGTAAISRGLALDHWEVALADMAVNFGDEFWRGFNGYLYWVPEQLLTARADQIDIALLSDLALASGLLDEASQQQLTSYSPDGSLQNFSLALPLAAGNQEPIVARTNLLDIELGSVRGSPNMWGITGFLEIEFDPVSERVTGLAEVESTDFSINIPNTFTRVWDYDYVNGRLLIDVDLSNGERTKLVSNTVVAESEAVDARLRFTSLVHRFPDGNREASLELMVGASRVDAEEKSLYLPDGPQVQANLRNSMEFLERAIVDGDIRDSAVLFRGNTIGGSAPVTKTFQSFFQLDNGVLNFSDEWPILEQISGLVVTDDNNIDIAVNEGSSLGVNLENAIGRIRRDGEDRSWLNITGQAAAATSAGLGYLQQTPVDESLRETFSTWEAEGAFTADVEVVIPLNQDDNEPDVRLDILLSENSLNIPEFDLAVSALTGPVVFDTRTGLEDSSLTAQMFGGAADINLSSEFVNDELETIIVEGSGRTTPADLSAWPRQSEFVRDLLVYMEGGFDYDARMLIDQTGLESINNSLSLRSELQGAGLSLPAPLSKEANESLSLNLHLEFDEERLGVSGSLGPELDMDLLIDDGVVQDGLLTLGMDSEEAMALSVESDQGLIIGANVDYFELQDWTDFVSSLGSAGESTSDYGNSIAFIEVSADVFSLYDQELAAVDMHMVPDSGVSGWLATVASESVAGSVVIPFDSQDYLLVDLDYLYLPGDDEEEQQLLVENAEAGAAARLEVEEEQIDPLLNLDPRELPLMEFSTDEFAIGSRDYGSWEFNLIPTDEGAEFNNLNFDFRGLRLGRDELDDRFETLEPFFRWQFDGEAHVSELTGVLVANDIGSVLQANGYAPSLESDSAVFVTEVSWPGSPAFFSGDNLSGRIDMLVEDGRFLRNSGGQGALRLVSFINLTAIFQRLRFSDDLLRRGLAFDEISGNLSLDEGLMHIEDRLVISGPSSLYQITGDVDLATENIEGEMFVTLPVSDNLPWIGLLTANIPLAVGAYLFDQIFGDQVDSLSSAVYTLSGPFEGLEPEFKQAFGSPDSEGDEAVPQLQ